MPSTVRCVPLPPCFLLGLTLRFLIGASCWAIYYFEVSLDEIDDAFEEISLLAQPNVLRLTLLGLDALTFQNSVVSATVTRDVDLSATSTTTTIDPAGSSLESDRRNSTGAETSVPMVAAAVILAVVVLAVGVSSIFYVRMRSRQLRRVVVLPVAVTNEAYDPPNARELEYAQYAQYAHASPYADFDQAHREMDYGSLV
eukprot:m.88060 g.88060  ORF g.88060 m.88060 type:complete len:199 (-) comp51007_c0_seq2:158-754(-)